MFVGVPVAVGVLEAVGVKVVEGVWDGVNVLVGVGVRLGVADGVIEGFPKLPLTVSV